DQRVDMESALQDARNQTWISLPVGAQITALEMASRGQADFEAAIQDLRTEIAIAIAGAFLQMLEGQQSGAAGSSQVHKSTAELYQWMLATQLGQVITDEIVPDLVDLNFEDAEYPKVELGSVNDAQLIASAQVDAILNQQLNIPLSIEEMYTKYQRSRPKNAEDALLGPLDRQAIQQQQAMEQQ